jgi:transposase
MQSKFEELSDPEWEIIDKIIGDQRNRYHSLRTIMNAIMWINYTGSQWRNLESKYPPWQSVYYYFRKWKITGVWEQLSDALVISERKRQKREETPSLLAFDSQSTKIVNFISMETGIDGGKKVNGRKRHLAVDTLGLPWAIYISAANVSDNQGGCVLIDKLKGKVPRMRKIAADYGYKDAFLEYVEAKTKWEVEIAQSHARPGPETARGFVPEKNRWPVERTYGWLNFRRRLCRDYEKTTESSEAMLLIAVISDLWP